MGRNTTKGDAKAKDRTKTAKGKNPFKDETIPTANGPADTATKEPATGKDKPAGRTADEQFWRVNSLDSFEHMPVIAIFTDGGRIAGCLEWNKDRTAYVIDDRPVLLKTNTSRRRKLPDDVLTLVDARKHTPDPSQTWVIRDKIGDARKGDVVVDKSGLQHTVIGTGSGKVTVNDPLAKKDTNAIVEMGCSSFAYVYCKVGGLPDKPGIYHDRKNIWYFDGKQARIIGAYDASCLDRNPMDLDEQEVIRNLPFIPIPLD